MFVSIILLLAFLCVITVYWYFKRSCTNNNNSLNIRELKSQWLLGMSICFCLWSNSEKNILNKNLSIVKSVKVNNQMKETKIIVKEYFKRIFLFRFNEICRPKNYFLISKCLLFAVLYIGTSFFTVCFCTNEKILSTNF